jgi:hypothetical protein
LNIYKDLQRLKNRSDAMIDSSSKKDVSSQKHEIRPTQSIELLKELHILTRDGKLNQDTRRKLKQVYHLVQFIEPLLQEVLNRKDCLSTVSYTHLTLPTT